MKPRNFDFFSNFGNENKIVDYFSKNQIPKTNAPAPANPPPAPNNVVVNVFYPHAENGSPSPSANSGSNSNAGANTDAGANTSSGANSNTGANQSTDPNWNSGENMESLNGFDSIEGKKLAARFAGIILGIALGYAAYKIIKYYNE